ncbi:MAG: KpsF/GutQ family sugar-phosphate isomerase [Alphaproteobacteria bacterium]|nr:KpsF/GutQ family sugar-phosphate isomerase [Alphaproteobacteria bacterium]
MQHTAAIETGRETISAEADALRQLERSLGVEFADAVELMAGVAGRLIISGVGKSGHIAGKIAATLASTGNPAHFVPPAEAAHGDMGMITTQDIMLVLSKSGNSAEFVPMLEFAVRHGIALIAVTANPQSVLAQHARVMLQLPAIGEAPMTDTPAPTNSTTMMLALGDALAVALLQHRGFTRADFAELHPGGQLGAQLTPVSQVMHQEDRVPLVVSTAPMRDVVLEITQKRLGCVGVLKGNRLVGIITDGDLRRHLDGDLLGRTAAMIATEDPKTIAPTLLCAEAITMMECNKITVLFVVEEQRPIGIVHLHDLLLLKVR